MTKTILTSGTAMATYIKDVKDQIKMGLGTDASLAGPINLEISTTLEKTGGGGFQISVLQLGAKVKQEQIHKIKIPIKFNSKADAIEEEARMAEAEARKAAAVDKKRQLE
jgi:hypothetical protein